tara:strand:- start:554 stop:667 length:114 start_codon:yes stop_codon:yes gene_type:complete
MPNKKEIIEGIRKSNPFFTSEKLANTVGIEVADLKMT